MGDLAERVEDWRTLKVDTFGDLLRFGTFTIVKNDTGKDSEREVRYLPCAYELYLLASEVGCILAIVTEDPFPILAQLLALGYFGNDLLTCMIVHLVSHLPLRKNPYLLQGDKSK